MCSTTSHSLATRQSIGYYNNEQRMLELSRYQEMQTQYQEVQPQEVRPHYQEVQPQYQEVQTQYQEAKTTTVQEQG